MARERKRRIKKADITFVSLCGRGRNLMGVVYKGEDAVEFKTLIVKSTDEGEITALVYVPDHPDYDGDFADAGVIKGLMDSWAANGQQLDLNHDCKPLSREQAYPLESFIVQKGDERFENIKDEDGHEVDASGAWAMVIKLKDEGLRQKARTGELGGVSMFGRAEFEMIEKGDAPEETQMNEEQLQKAIEESLTKAGLTGAKIAEIAKAAAAEALKDASQAKSSEKPTFTPPAFEGDATSENVRKHALAVQKARVLFELKTETDPAKLEALAKSLEELEELGKPGKDDGGQIKKGTSSQDTTSDGTNDNLSEAEKLEKARKQEIENLADSAQYANPKLTRAEAIAKAQALV